MKHLMTGNEAIARGAFEAGVKVCSAYPGTPSTEILENMPQYGADVYCEWAPNEKVAAEVAYGASISGVRALCAMKHVGVNVAADPIFTASYNGVGGGYVVVSADDPGMHSSQNEQDNRYYAKFAKMAMVEPSDSQECKDFMQEAFDISQRFDIPVLFRTTTRVCHSKSLVEFGERADIPTQTYKKEPEKYVCAPANAKKHHPILEKKLEVLQEYAETSPLNSVEINGSGIGVITASVAYQYAKEAMPPETSFLKLGFTWPLPMKLIRDFASKMEILYVVEELEPFMEEQIKAAGISVVGKDKIPNMFELDPEIVAHALLGTEPETVSVEAHAVSRPPVLCAGCPHRGFFYALSGKADYVVSADIGCYTLGAAKPLDAIDSVLCMGGGFSVAAGFAKGFEMSGQKSKKVFGVMGDSTFFHSGMTGAAEIAYNNDNVILCVLDNGITAMTGHQNHPGTGKTLMGQPADAIRIEKVLAACGYENIIIVDPQNIAAMEQAVEDALNSTVRTAIITRRPCLLYKEIKHDIGLCTVAGGKCRKCRKCLKVGCPAVMLQEDGKAGIDKTLCVGCTVCAQICPFGAIERIGDKSA